MPLLGGEMIRLFRNAAFGAAIVCLAAMPALADDSPGALARKAEEAAAAGRTVEALDLAELFNDAVWDAAPLAFRRAELVDNAPAAFGEASPRASNVYGADEEIRIYAEPVAFGWRRTGGGFETDMVADVRVSTDEGRIVVGQKAISTLRIAAESRNTGVFATFAYTFRGLKPGDYVVTTTLNDQVSGKSAAFALPIRIE